MAIVRGSSMSGRGGRRAYAAAAWADRAWSSCREYQGSIGGAVAMNAGAYGGDVASCDWIGSEFVARSGELVRLPAAKSGAGVSARGAAAGGGGGAGPVLGATRR